MTTAIYARYSSHAQDGGTSIDVQIDTCSRALDGQEAKHYIDRARTGRSMAGRVALLQLLADAEARKFDRLLIYKYDRLGRNLAESSTIFAELEDCGVEVVSVTEGKDALARGMHLVIGEHYSRALAERTKDGLVKRFEEHAWTGGPPPYGYTIEVDENKHHRLAIREDEAGVVKWIFRTYASEAAGIKELAHRMRARGIPTRRAPYWSHISVRDILTKSIYTGRIAYNRRRFKINKRTGRRVPVWRGEAEHLVQQDERLRIVDDAVFQQVQERLSSRASAGGGQLRSEARPFTGLIFCEECGSVCYRRSSNNRKGQYHYYSCGRRQRSGLDVCQNTASIREDQLLGKISETLVGVFDDADAIIEEAVEEARKMLGKTREDAQQIRGQLAELDRKVTAMTRLLIDPEIETLAKKALSRQLGELESESERLQKVLVETSKRAGDYAEQLADAIRQAMKEARECLSSAATSTELREFVDRWVGPVVLRPDGSVVQRTLATEESSEASVKGLVAGARYAAMHHALSAWLTWHWKLPRKGRRNAT